MKYIASFIFLLLSFNSYSQLEEDTLYNSKEKLIEQTRFIMKELGINVRPNVSKDGMLNIGMIDTAIVTRLEGFFKDSGLVILNYDTSLRYYLYPIIALKEPIFKVFRKQKDTTQMGLVACLSVAIHEITHYLQLTHTPNQTGDIVTLSQFTHYLNDESEMEAHAVQSYYFLFYYDKVTLMKILSDETSPKKKMVMLYDAFNQYTVPNWRPLFQKIKKKAS